MKTVKLRTVILYGLCAMSWIIRVIVGFIYKEYNRSVFVFVLNVLCSAIWVLAFIKWLIQYRLNTDVNNKSTC